jgi:hypothetical protein
MEITPDNIENLVLIPPLTALQRLDRMTNQYIVVALTFRFAKTVISFYA